MEYGEEEWGQIASKLYMMCIALCFFLFVFILNIK